MTNTQKAYFEVIDTEAFRRRATVWAFENFTHACLLDPSDTDYPHGTFPKVLAVGAFRIFPEKEYSDHFEGLKEFRKAHKSYLFGFLSYDLKNETEDLESRNPDRKGSPPCGFFEPLHLIFFRETGIEILSKGNPADVFEAVKQQTEEDRPLTPTFGKFTADFDRESYKTVVEKLRHHIEEGDCYEVNFCMGFHREAPGFKPVETYEKLRKVSPTPFAGLLRFGSHFTLCASPERFMKKEDIKLISQPIKGTIKRGKTAKEDQKLKDRLRNDPKELSENMMIVDLVRNDLAKTAQTGSVQAEELFGIYTFEKLHQMISTVSAKLSPVYRGTDALKAAFPMGSMTGAPKVKVMKLIEHYERSRRGIYSGSIGFLSPDNNFDFNVVIRSVFWNAETGICSFQVGSAITYDSRPEAEYDECMLKAQAVLEVLNG